MSKAAIIVGRLSKKGIPCKQFVDNRQFCAPQRGSTYVRLANLLYPARHAYQEYPRFARFHQQRVMLHCSARQEALELSSSMTKCVQCRIWSLTISKSSSNGQCSFEEQVIVLIFRGQSPPPSAVRSIPLSIYVFMETLLLTDSIDHVVVNRDTLHETVLNSKFPFAF